MLIEKPCRPARVLPVMLPNEAKLVGGNSTGALVAAVGFVELRVFGL